jgi:hypothetical protein
MMMHNDTHYYKVRHVHKRIKSTAIDSVHKLRLQAQMVLHNAEQSSTSVTC